jgi:EF hand
MEISMNLKTLMALAIAAAFAAPVLAQTAPSAAGASAGGFSAMDRNNDGYISRDEARDATWNSRFSELDKDNDGRLSQSEHDAMHGAAGATSRDAQSPSTTGGMGGSVGPAGTQSGSSTSGIGDKPGQKQ